MAKQEPKIELVYVGLHPGEEEMTLEEVENEEQENQLDMAREAIRRASGPSAFKERIRVFRTEEEKSADGSGIGAIDLNANNDEQRNVPVSSLFQTWRQKMNALPRIEVPRSLTAKQFLEIQAMGAESRD